MKEYSDDPDDARLSDFTPTEALYDTYLNYVNQYVRTAADLPTLTRTQFGAAVSRVFAQIGKAPHLRAVRTVNGERVKGFLGLKGPASVRAQNLPGNTRSKGRPSRTLADLKAATARPPRRDNTSPNYSV